MWAFHTEGHMGFGWGWWIFGFTMMVIFWGAIFWIVVNFARSFNQTPSDRRIEDPLDIAARRYAAGEVDQDEYERIVRRLGPNSEASPLGSAGASR